MNLKNMNVGFCITGSYCTHEKVISELERVVFLGANVTPIISPSVAGYDTRFGLAEDLKNKLVEITGNKIITSIVEAEPIGPKNLCDVVIVAPCTGNTLAKLANSITDNCVTMEVKAHQRNQKPVVIAISTNDGLSGCAKNIGVLLNCKNIFFVPFGQDAPFKKCNSLVAKFNLIVPTMELALEGKQIQPLLISNN